MRAGRRSVSVSVPGPVPVLVPAPASLPGDTNLAPIIRADGSLLALGRPPWVWEATDWRDNSTYTVTRRDGGTIPGEDPFLYVDAYNASVLHGLSHAGGWDSSHLQPSVPPLIWRFHCPSSSPGRNVDLF